MYKITDGLKEQMGPRKDEGSYWGYEERGNGQLQSVQSFQTYHRHYSIMLKTDRKAEVKQ